MSKRSWYALALVSVLAGGAQASAPAQDYARQWPLALGQDNAGAYRVLLDEAVYLGAHERGLRDVEVFNAQGQAVAAAVLSPAQPLAQAPRTTGLPWFPLPAQDGAGNDIHLIAERDDEGNIRRVQAGFPARTPAGGAGSWLVDASRVREPVRALLLEWKTPSQPLQAGYKVEGSDDLRNWRTLNGSTTLLDLERGGERLRQGRIALDGQARYLRLLPLRAGPGPELTGVAAELAPAEAQLQWDWQELRGERRSVAGREGFEFRLPGRFPVERADVRLPDNAAVQWTLYSREDPDASWTWRAGPWVAYQVGDDRAGARSEPRALAAAVRDRYWRLVPTTPVGEGMPVLRLGYRSEVLVFLAQGQPPYTLAAGSARRQRGEAPIKPLLDALRAQRGPDWEPAPAYLAGEAQELAGERALEPLVEHDWKSWLLWALLVGGAVLVALLGMSLLRQPPRAP
ncbi:DUF3999 domain-containing protein [Pseudoxanthomonas sp. SGNA-20]|uniref:DUF3999 domain-containing protein n=1 Tax=Pseudoxanthomonas sp. SGNA-20 TaxID=2493088 RepID=UPI0018F5E748|nr:DUF3999 domain-containing protein [Pseudoxanthomonas sp. SGNA-20]